MAKAPEQPRTLGELKASGYTPRTLREELRANLISALESGANLFPGILGYEDSVLPQLENAVLSGHDIILLGERGQAKTRLIRALVALLDPYIPMVQGSEVHDSPFAPVSRFARERLKERGDDTEVQWVSREERYAEKLATPDTTAAELIGEIDPIKVAEGRYLSDERTIHYGLIPRANRGIFAINELPDLAEKVQVSLFNILEERDIQIKGYKLRLPLDVLVVATANPEDYTSRGRIITPLKDRYSAHIRTHYPRTRELEVAIIEQEAACGIRQGRPVILPGFLKEIVAEITFQARRSPDVSQVSGVSVRMSISNMESVISSAERRAIRHREPVIVPRLTDLAAILATTDGKLELEYSSAETSQRKIIDALIRQAVLAVFDQYLRVEDLEPLVAGFSQGGWVEVSDAMPARDYLGVLSQLKGARPGLAPLGLGESPGELAAAAEFLLEGLHLHNRLHKEVVEGKVIYNETDKIPPLGRNTDLA
ncbi:MAG: AAA family ATPase [Deltaproteobacteria bacterium]|nr:AAA family ATPase [Deltaproteobacteria bacterium]